MCCSVLQRVAVCSVLQCFAVCCSVLQCVAVCCSAHTVGVVVVLQSRIGIGYGVATIRRLAVCCSVL